MNSKNFKKRINFPIFKETFFFGPTGVFTSLGVANFRVTLRDRVQIFLKKGTIHENDMIHFLFSFSLHGSNVNSENVNEKNITYFV